MKRLFWVAVGAAVGVLVVRRLNEKAEQLTPAGVAEGLANGLAQQATKLTAVARQVADEIREEMAGGEEQIRASLGLDEPAEHAGGESRYAADPYDEPRPRAGYRAGGRPESGVRRGVRHPTGRGVR